MIFRILFDIELQLMHHHKRHNLLQLQFDFEQLYISSTELEAHLHARKTN
jgi:hypothetical protein